MKINKHMTVPYKTMEWPLSYDVTYFCLLYIFNIAEVYQINIINSENLIKYFADYICSVNWNVLW